MRISDWSSDVCSSDLQAQISGAARGAAGDDAVGDLGDGGVEVSHNSKTVCPELVEGPFFLATPIEKDCPSTSSGRTEFLGAIFFQSCQLAPSRSISAIDELGPDRKSTRLNSSH